MQGLRCRHEFEALTVHANGAVSPPSDRTGIRVIWQFVVFRWSDRDEHFERAIRMAEGVGIAMWFDFAHTWGRSRRRPRELQDLRPYLRPFTAFPGQKRDGGW